MHTTSIPLPLPRSSSQEGEPPRKKRRSKWDIQPKDLETTANSNHETTPPQAPTSAAAAAAARLNAKLASEGKLKPASTVYMVSLRQPGSDDFIGPALPYTMLFNSLPSHTYTPTCTSMSVPYPDCSCLLCLSAGKLFSVVPFSQYSSFLCAAGLSPNSCLSWEPGSCLCYY